MAGGILKKFRGTVLIISHDRYFLDNVVTRTVEIANGRPPYSGNYSYYVQEKGGAIRAACALRAEQAEAKRLQEAADRLHQWARQQESQSGLAIENASSALCDGAALPRKVHRGAVREKDFAATRFSSSKTSPGLIWRGAAGFALSQAGRIASQEITARARRRSCASSSAREARFGIIRLGPSVKAAYLPQAVSFSNENRRSPTRCV